jgi:hypothetical protein
LSEDKDCFSKTLSRTRLKELAHDYLERETTADSASIADLVAREALKAREGERTPSRTHGPSPMADLESRQQQAAERWKARQHGPEGGQGSKRTHTPTPKADYEIERKPELRRDGPEDDLEIQASDQPMRAESPGPDVAG